MTHDNFQVLLKTILELNIYLQCDTKVATHGLAVSFNVMHVADL